MQMHAITKHYGLEEAIKLAVNAGVDIMTFSNNISGSDERTVDKVHSIIRGMVESGTIPRARIDESFDRIMGLKRKLYPANKELVYQQELLAKQKKLDAANAVLAEHEQYKDVIEKARKKKAKRNKNKK
jgi:beta-N-acetylhexosaminidase